MPVATIHAYSPEVLTTMQQSPRGTLRRATYVHVSDLISAYNIDHSKLEEEIFRVKMEKEREVSAPIESEVANISPVSGGGDGDASIESAPHQQKRLQPPRGGYNLCVLVGEVKVVVDKLRVDRSRVRLAEVRVGDETGCISLRARDDQIDVLREVSDRSGAVVLRNCTLELFQGRHLRLAVTKWGKLNPYPDQVASTPPPPSKMNKDRNFSLIDLSLVASEMVNTDPTIGSDERVSAVESRGASAPGRAGSRTQQYPHYQPRKQGRDRRQTHQSHSYGHQTHFSDPPLAAHMAPMGYQGLHGFSQSYGEGMAVARYSYGPPSQNRVQEGAGQHLLLQQQYEMQQRQMQQIHAYHEQQERHRPRLSGPGPMPPSSMVPPNVSSSPSFDTTGGQTTSTPMFSPGPFQQEPYGAQSDVSRMGLMPPQGEYLGSPQQSVSNQRKESGHPRVGREKSSQEAWGSHGSSPSGPHLLSSGPDSPVSLSPSQMNPGAQAFDPGFMKQSGQTQSYPYILYDSSQGPAPMYARPPHPGYSQNVGFSSGTGNIEVNESRQVTSQEARVSKTTRPAEGGNTLQND